MSENQRQVVALAVIVFYLSVAFGSGFALNDAACKKSGGCQVFVGVVVLIWPLWMPGTVAYKIVN